MTRVDTSRLRSRNPWTGATNGEVAIADGQQVLAAVQQAKQAQSAWGKFSVAERGAFLTKARQHLMDRAEQIVTTLHDENGKPTAEAYFSEILPDIDLFSYYIKETGRLVATERVTIDPLKYPGKSGRIRYEPKGVIAVISPWNYPVALPLRIIVPALMAGNTVVFKPSEQTPLCGNAVADLFADLPDGVFHVLQGGADTGRALVDAPVDHVSFTGSLAAGRHVAVRCAEKLISCSLELGGKDAAIVLADADLDRAADGIAWGAFTNAGQNCASIERVYVEASVAEPFLSKLAERVKALDDHAVGPVQNEAQLATVRHHLDDALRTGARIVAQVARPDGQIGPTVLADCPADSLVMREETFGPLLPVTPVPSATEAIRLANDSPYGLTASIWTRDLARGQALAGDLTVGVVTVNNHSFTGAMVNAPWSGRKASGMGTTNSHIALKELVKPKFVLVDRSKGKDLWWFPHNPAALAIVRAMTVMMGGPGSKLAALKQLLPNFLARWKP